MLADFASDDAAVLADLLLDADPKQYAILFPVLQKYREETVERMRREVRGDGQFDVVWKTPGLVPGDAWSNFLPGSKDLEADWVTLKCGNYNKVTKKRGGSS